MGRFVCIVSYVIVYIYFVSGLVTDTTVSIILNKNVTYQNNQVYGKFVQLNATATLQVDIQNLTSSSFVIFQVHSHVYNVTLYDWSMSKKNSIQGANLGMYGSLKTQSLFYVYNQNKNMDLRLYVSVHLYDNLDPIPGGCNMEFSLPISPFLLTSYNKDYGFVDAAPPKMTNDSGCQSNSELMFYRLYLPEGDGSEDAYFNGLLKMMTLEGILTNGELLPVTGVMWNMRRMLAAYPGTGSIYAAVAVYGNRYSVYVPAHSYACSPVDDDGGCSLLDDVASQFVCAGLLFLGVFVCYFGHEFFKVELFLVGLACGAVVTYIILYNAADFDRAVLIGLSVLVGAACGYMWYLLWRWWGMPVLAVMLTVLSLGFLAAAIMYYRMPGGISSLEQDFNFWTLFIFVIMSTSVLLISTPHISNIICCCILGAYAAIYSIDYYMGSNLKYIMINVIRRATVPKFNYAIVSPPFELSDAVLTLIWVTLALTGFLAQHHTSRGRPPFPPPPHVVSNRMPSPDPGPSVYGTLPIPKRRNNSRPCSRDGSRPASRTGSRSRLSITPAVYQSIQKFLDSHNSSTGEKSSLIA